MTNHDAATVVAGSQVVFTDLGDGEGVLVDLDAKQYFTLNETACVVWRGIVQTQGPLTIARTLSDAYEVTVVRAEESVARIIDEFRRLKLVQPAG